MENSRTEIEQAKAILKQHGYFVDNLWSASDVTGLYKCTNEEAFNVLYGVLTNDYIVEQINLAIDNVCEAKGIYLIEEDNED